MPVVAILFSCRVALLRNCPPAQPEQENIHCALARRRIPRERCGVRPSKLGNSRNPRWEENCGDGPSRRVTVDRTEEKLNSRLPPVRRWVLEAPELWCGGFEAKTNFRSAALLLT
jgi:hypothetical protein